MKNILRGENDAYLCAPFPEKSGEVLKKSLRIAAFAGVGALMNLVEENKTLKKGFAE